jgi:predicted DCC family thiol-disulfide oxidoreductase YuxK
MSPSAAVRSEATTLVFDGDCGFCTSAVEWLKRVLPAAPPATPYQWADLERLGLTVEEASSMVWLVSTDASGSVHQSGGYLAVSELLRHQPAFGWRFLGILMDTPPFFILSDFGYRLIARFRYLLPGGTPACRTGRET